MNKEKLKGFFEVILILAIFILFSYLIQENLDFFKGYLDTWHGMLIFILILTLSIVFSIISAIPLFPIATALWGETVTAFLGVIGWTVGAVIAFIIARKYGVSLVKKLIPINKLSHFQKKIPNKNLFFTVVFIRMILPIDGLSYILGLFSRMSLKSYTIATIIGLIPFCFAFAYFGAIPVYYQIMFILICLTLFLIGFLIAHYRTYFEKISFSKIRSKKKN